MCATLFVHTLFIPSATSPSYLFNYISILSRHARDAKFLGATAIPLQWLTASGCHPIQASTLLLNRQLNCPGCDEVCFKYHPCSLTDDYVIYYNVRHNPNLTIHFCTSAIEKLRWNCRERKCLKDWKMVLTACLLALFSQV